MNGEGTNGEGGTGEGTNGTGMNGTGNSDTGDSSSEEDCELPTIEDHLNSNELVLECMPPLVIGMAVVLNWGDAGWSRGVVKRACNARQKRKGFRWLVRHDGERWSRPHALEEDKYSTHGPAGSWASIAINPEVDDEAAEGNDS